MALYIHYILTFVVFDANILVNCNPHGFQCSKKSARRWKSYLLPYQLAVGIGIFRILTIYKYLIPVCSLSNRLSEIKPLLELTNDPESCASDKIIFQDSLRYRRASHAIGLCKIRQGQAPDLPSAPGFPQQTSQQFKPVFLLLCQ